MTVINIFTKQEVVSDHDEWAEIGVHIEVRLASGMHLDDAANELIISGVDTERLNQYLKHNELRHPERMEEIDQLYTKEENQAIQSWLIDSPLDPQADGEKMWNAARVAEIVLFPIRTSLPQWAAVCSDGNIAFGREHQLRAIRARDQLLEPRFLFQINWADTAPGLCWPESYHLTMLPGYRINVITASHDSADMFGYTDLALCVIPPKRDGFLPSRSVLDGVARWWRSELEGWDQGPWESLWDPGGFNPHKLLALRDKIWADYKI